ncbi:MAG: hypothetical protein ACHRHE_19975 [Tepidisphaerales bacterium]
MTQSDVPQTLTSLQPAFDRRRWTATNVRNPALALIDKQQHLGIILARDMEEDSQGIHMRSVTWVRIPQGWGLAVLRFRARFRPVRLPDEWLFNDLVLTQASDGMYIARLGSVARHPLVLPTPSPKPYPVKPLTSAQYWSLAEVPGRLLRARVVAMFPAQFAPLKHKQTSSAAPRYPTGPASWTVFGE